MIKWLKIVWKKYKEEHIFNYKILNFDRYYNILLHKFLRSQNFHVLIIYIYIYYIYVGSRLQWLKLQNKKNIYKNILILNMFIDQTLKKKKNSPPNWSNSNWEREREVASEGIEAVYFLVWVTKISSSCRFGKSNLFFFFFLFKKIFLIFFN